MALTNTYVYPNVEELISEIDCWAWPLRKRAAFLLHY